MVDARDPELTDLFLYLCLLWRLSLFTEPSLPRIRVQSRTTVKREGCTLGSLRQFTSIHLCWVERASSDDARRSVTIARNRSSNASRTDAAALSAGVTDATSVPTCQREGT